MSSNYNSNDLKKFFRRLEQGDGEGARKVFQDLAFPGDPELRAAGAGAQDYVESGEWEGPFVKLYCISDSKCAGHIGMSEPPKVCVKGKTDCRTEAHSKPLVLPGSFGWRIGAGQKTEHGAYEFPFLPTAANGGPFSVPVEAYLSDSTNPFVMPRAQWFFLFDLLVSADGLDDDEVDPDVLSDDESGLQTNTSDDEEALEASYAPLRAELKHADMEALIADAEEGTDTATPEGSVEKIVAVLRNQFVSRDRYKKVKVALEEVKENQLALTQQLADKAQSTAELTQRLLAMEKRFNDQFKRLSSTIRRMEQEHAANQSSLEVGVRELQEQATETAEDVSRARRLTKDVEYQLHEGKAIEFHSKTFTTIRELASLCKLGNIGVGCSADGFLLMNLPRTHSVSEEEGLKTRKGRNDIKAGTAIESVFVISFGTTTPATLAPTKSTSSDLPVEALKTLLKSPSVWEREDGLGGVKHSILSSANHCRERIEHFANSAGISDEGRSFCIQLISDLSRFVSQFVEFISKFYAITLKTSGMSEGALWELCLEIIAHVIDEIATVRNVHVDRASEEPAWYYWGMLKAWEVQNRYLAADFINDPSLNGIFVRRAVLRKNEFVVKLEKDVRLLTQRVSSIKPKGGGRGGARAEEVAEE